MVRKITQGATVELRGGTLRGSPECPVVGDLKGTKAVVIREPRRSEGPSGRIEDRCVVKPILSNGALGFPIEIAADHIGTSNAFLPKLRRGVARVLGGGPTATAEERRPTRDPARRSFAGIGPGRLRRNYGYVAPDLQTAED